MEGHTDIAWDDASSSSPPVVLFSLAMFGYMIYGATSFGAGITYQLVYQLLSLAGLADGRLSAAAEQLYITTFTANIMQSIVLRKHATKELVVLVGGIAILFLPIGIQVLLLMEGSVAVILKHCLGFFFGAVGLLQGYSFWKAAYGTSGQKECLSYHELNSTAKLHLVLASAGFGFFAGLFNTGGPPMMIFLLLHPMHMVEWRACQAVGSLLIALEGNVIFSVLRSTAAAGSDAIPPLPLITRGALIGGTAAGLTLGNLLAPRIELAQLRVFIISLLLIASGTMLSAGHPTLQVYITMASIMLAILGGVCAVLQRVYRKVYPSNNAVLGDSLLSPLHTTPSPTLHTPIGARATRRGT